MKIKAKIYLFILTTSVVIFAATIGFITQNYKSKSLIDAERIANASAGESANMAQAILNTDVAIARTLQNSFQDYKKVPKKLRDEIYKDILENTLIENPDYTAVWLSWELNAIDTSWEKNYGRVRYIYHRINNEIRLLVDSVNLNGDNPNSDYYRIKQTGEEYLSNPYYFPYGKDTIFESSICSPIMVDKKLVGVSGLDVPLTRFQNIIQKVKTFKTGDAFLIANNGIIVAHAQPSLMGKNIEILYSNQNVLQNIQLGKSFSFTNSDEKGENFVSFVPIFIGKTKTPWSMGVSYSLDEIMKEANHNFNISILVWLIGQLILSIMIFIISQNITVPLNQTIGILGDLDKGIIDKNRKLKIKSKDELGEVARSVNNLVDTLNDAASFAKQVGKGNLEVSFEVKSEFDELGNALLEMRKNLIQAKEEEEKMNFEGQKLNWSQQGIANIGEILRQNSDNMKEFSYAIMSNLVKYLGAAQGGMFIVNDNDKHNIFVELLAAYAFDRKKTFESKLAIGENLVGRCVQEKERIYITNLPEGYMYVTSGLGEKTPNVLLIVPLIFSEETFGAIEIASFNAFENFQIDFVEKIAERIASTISIIKKNVKTAELLKQFQDKSEELAVRETEMRENFKELQIAQEKAVLKEQETAGILEAITSAASVVYYDINGNILEINDKNLETMGYRREDIVGRNQSEFAPEARNNPKWYREFWNDLRTGIPRKRIFHHEYKGNEIWISEHYTPILKDGKPYKIINIGFDITEIKLQTQKLTQNTNLE